MTLAAPVQSVPTSRPPRLVMATVLTWLGRLMALALLLLWGVFFVEHVQEWFIAPQGAWPPPKVWAAMVVHLAILLGFAAMWRWERVGIVTVVVSTAGFLALLGAFVPLTLVNLAPVAALAAALMLRRGARG